MKNNKIEIDKSFEYCINLNKIDYLEMLNLQVENKEFKL